MEPNRINRQNRTNPKGQFVTTFNNSGKIIKYNNEKYNIPGSLNNTASSSFQNQQKNQNFNNNNFNYTNQNQNQEYFFSQGTNKYNTSINSNKGRKTPEKEYIEPLEVECNGDKPLSRFGHSLVMIDPVKVCLFGGV